MYRWMTYGVSVSDFQDYGLNALLHLPLPTLFSFHSEVIPTCYFPSHRCNYRNRHHLLCEITRLLFVSSTRFINRFVSESINVDIVVHCHRIIFCEATWCARQWPLAFDTYPAYCCCPVKLVNLFPPLEIASVQWVFLPSSEQCTPGAMPLSNSSRQRKQLWTAIRAARFY